MSPTSPPVVVAGAGWAGLSAAVRLVQEGIAVHLVESAPIAGGRAREARIDFGLGDAGPIVLDAGQHLLVGAYRECLELAATVHDGELPFERHALLLRDTAGLRIAAAPLPAPLHLVVALLRARGLRAPERWAALRLIAGLRARGWRVRPGQTVAGLLEHYRQPWPLVQRLWAPLCIAALNTACEQACAAAFATVLRDTLGGTRDASDFVLPRGSLADAIAHPALDWLRRHGARISLSTRMRALQPSGNGWQLRLDENTVDADQVVLATPAWISASLLGSLDVRAARLEGFDYEAIGTVYLAWPQAQALPLPGWVMLRELPDRGQYGQWLFDRGVHGTLRIAAAVVSARGRLHTDSAAAIAQGIARQVAEQLELPMPAAHRTVTEKRATLRCTPGRPRLAEDAFADTLPGLWLAGDYLDPEYPATLESAVRSGRRAAARVAARVADLARSRTARPSQPQALSSA